MGMKEAWERATCELTCTKCGAKAIHSRDFAVSEPFTLYGRLWKTGSVWRICKVCKNKFNIFISFIPEWAWEENEKEIAEIEIKESETNVS